MKEPEHFFASASARAWSEELARIIWCQNVAERLVSLGTWLGYPKGALPPAKPVRFAEFESAEKG